MSNNYTGLRRLRDADPLIAQRCAERLLAMRRSLEPLRARKRDTTLLLATWNIRDFGSDKFNFGDRLDETYYYLAEIISCFDLVALQEVNRNLADFDRVMRILGSEWDYIATDATEGRGGNDERMAFVFNREKVFFRKIAGEIVLPDGQLIVSREKMASPTAGSDAIASNTATEAAIDEGFKEVSQQFARTPFVVAFQSGWFKFNLCTVHIYYGDNDDPELLARRIDEIRKLVGFFAKRQDSENRGRASRPADLENYILLGDFNVVSPEHETMQALIDQGFTVPAAIDGDEFGKERDHFYDQIAVRVMDNRFSVTAGGMVDMFADVFRDNETDLALYAPYVPKAKSPKTLEGRYRKWRTWQMSDHRPLWIEIDSDFADFYLSEFATATG